MSDQQPIPMRLNCPECGELHVDEGEFATKIHTTHACQACGGVWRPAVVPTVGVRFLPGFKNEDRASSTAPVTVLSRFVVTAPVTLRGHTALPECPDEVANLRAWFEARVGKTVRVTCEELG